MRRQVELYIKKDNESGTGYDRVDLFDFEDININNSIKDARDIGKVFTEFTQEFKVPASKNNNKLFSHYYNWDISVGGFDARLKVPALIKINGVDYKKGRLTLKGSALDKNRAKNYSVVFYGETVSLKQLLSDDKLKDLNTSHLNQFNVAYLDSVVRTAFSNGYNLLSGGSLSINTSSTTAGDLCVPFISAQNYYFYDTTQNAPNPQEGASESRNINVNESSLVTPRGISFKDLKFGIRVYHIIKAIEEKYGLTFSTDFFSTTNLDFYELYLLLSKEKGQYSDVSGTVVVDFDDFILNSSDTELRPLTAQKGSSSGSGGDFDVSYSVLYTVQTSNFNSRYSITVTNKTDGSTIFDSKGGGQSTSFVFGLPKPSSPNSSIVYDLEFKVQGENLGNPSHSASVTKATTTYGGGQAPVTTTQVSLYTLGLSFSKFNPTSNMPDIKVIDFLTGLFKTFNLVAYYDNDKINVKTLVDYYDNGQSIDLTEYVDNSVINLNRTNLHSTINFEFEKPSTFAIINSNDATSDEFGNEKMDNLNQDPEIFSTLAFDGGTYSVKNKFEKIMYERMTNQTGGANTNVGWGWLVNKDQESVATKPILFYGIKQELDDNPSGYLPSSILFDNTDGTYDNLSQYIRASNTRSYYSSGSLVEAQSINFGSEFDEFHQVENTTSLFKTYYEEYVQDIYNRRSRILKVKAFLPVNVILKMTLDDEVTIGNRLYGINKMKLNLNTGKADLELMTRTESKLT
jgi:hypothetical protein